MNDDFEERGPRKAHGGPYTSKHPVPTIRGYREHRAEIKEREHQIDNKADYQGEEQGESKTRRAYESIKTISKDQDRPWGQKDPYPTANRNVSRPDPDEQRDEQDRSGDDGDEDEDADPKKEKKEEKSATETVAGSIDPKEKRKMMKKAKRSGGGRDVTDPVTHLPVVVHDMTDEDLKSSPENEPSMGEDPRTLTGIDCEDKGEDQLEEEKAEMGKGHGGMHRLFPPPNFKDTKREMMRVYRRAVVAGLSAGGVLVVLAVGAIWIWRPRETEQKAGWCATSTISRHGSWMSLPAILGVTAALVYLVVKGTSDWLVKRVDNIFEDETWDAARHLEMDRNESEIELPESVQWLNSLLSSVWRLINPDLFSSLVDTLEDVMQASLPKVIRMVSVDDIGQGSEAFRVLGVRWLPTGAAGQSVDTDGNLKPSKENDRTTVDKAQDDKAQEDKSQDSSANSDPKSQQVIREGMEAEEGDFVNLELAFSYRARSSGKSIKSKAKNAHLYLKFYLPGGVAVPVWVELRGLVGVMRLRLQLTPDPPFFQLCTLTFLGQPRADLSCVPLSKHSLNIMDVPLISSFVQSSIDAALAEYVAPKSLTLDLKDMLMGSDFKKDTLARGVIAIHIQHASGFKDGDGLLGSSDCYVAVSWGKFGKPVFSTRIIKSSRSPVWNEWAHVLVTPDEINASETLRLQLWDSDKHTADDDLGRVTIQLSELMHSSDTQNKLCSRCDNLSAQDPDESMPGTLTWRVGFFAKAHIQPCQLESQTFDPSIRSVEEAKSRVLLGAKSKLREATNSPHFESELKQQRQQDYAELESSMIISAPPPTHYPSGILSVQIHNITGLEVAQLNRPRKSDPSSKEDDSEGEKDLPSGYATVILNHVKIYRTRTKPKNSKPFFNAGTERFVKDWKSAEVIISVRDAREGENDPLLGVVYLPLRRVFEKRSQVMATYPLAGGIGYGRCRVSLVWRSVEAQLGRELRGWDFGTAEVKRVSGEGLEGRVKVRAGIGKGKIRVGEEDGDGVFLGVVKRYATSLVVTMKGYKGEKEALAVLWLGDVPDEEETVVKLKVWKGGKKEVKKARSHAGYEGGEGQEPLGEVEVCLRFWRGLSGYHKAWANKPRNQEVKGVMEVLDTVNDEKMAEDEDSSLGSWDSDIDSDSDCDSTSDSGDFGPPGNRDSQAEAEKRKMLRKAGDSSSSESDSEDDTGLKKVAKMPSKLKDRASSLMDAKEGSDDDGSRGPMDQLRDYKKHRKQMHRKHKGVMQWKATRSLDWMVDKVKEGKGKIGEAMQHGDKGQGIETEV
ncbi:hypothetical protein OQA88_11841 [Cercophora sp. LCS_1]